LKIPKDAASLANGHDFRMRRRIIRTRHPVRAFGDDAVRFHDQRRERSPLPERTFSSASAMARFMNSGDMTCLSSVVQIVLSASNSQRGIFLLRGIT